MRFLLPLTAWLLLGVSAGTAQVALLDCGQPADVTISSAATQANIRFHASAGESVYIRLIATAADAGFALTAPVVASPYGALYAPRPHVQSVSGATPFDLAGGFDSRETYTGLEFDLPFDGDYTLRLVSANFAASGTIHAVLARLNRPCGVNTTLTCGRSLPGNIATTTPGQVDTYQFNVTAGDVVTFRMLRVATAGALDTSTYFFFAIYAADASRNGAPYAVNVDAATKRISYAQISGRFDWTSTVTGTVNVVVFDLYGSHGGSYFLSATRLNGGCGGAALSCNSVVDGQISSPLTIASYRMQVNGGDVYQFRSARQATSGTFAPGAEIYDDAGTRIGVVPGGTASGHAPSLSSITFPRSGGYSVMVSGPSDGSLGAFTLATLRLNRACEGAQALSCSSVVDGAVKGMLRSQIYSLSASANDAYLVGLFRPDATNLFSPRVDIYAPGGAPVTFLGTTGLQRQTFSVPADGVYTLVVTDSYDSAQSGAYSLSTLRLNRPCGASTLSCGAPSGGSLGRSLSSAVYAYTAAAGESFSVRMLPGTGTPQTSLQVYDGQGNSVGQSLTGSFTGVDVPRPAAGDYSIVATDASVTPSASTFTLDLLRTVNACGISSATQGAGVNGIVSGAIPFVTYRVPATSGDLLSLRSSSSTAGFAAQMELYDPDGLRLDSSTFGLSRKVAASGAYTVIVGAASPLTAGGYSFVWQLLNRPAGAGTLTCGGSTPGALSSSSQFRYYSFGATAGDVLRLLFTRISDNFSPQIEVFDPSGVRISANSDITQKAAATGNYLVLVSPSSTAAETGAYNVAFQRPNNPCSAVSLTCGQTALRQVGVPAQVDTFAFNATGGDVTTIRLASRTGAYSPYVELYNPAGALVTTSSNGLVSRTLPADGAYTLLVRDRGGLSLGSYRVSVQDDTNACTVADSDAPAITLLRPTGGEVIPGGTVYRIQWQSDDNVGVAAHTLALSTDGGKTFADPFASVGGNAQAYDWMVPADVAPTRVAVLRLTATDAAGNAQSAASDLLTLIGSGFTPNFSASYTYDGLNRLIRAVWADGTTVQYTWDAAGNLASIAVTSGQ